ncbi:MAG: transglutaminase-like domain-containing protein [Desulfurococcaceae archaeon]
MLKSSRLLSLALITLSLSLALLMNAFSTSSDTSLPLTECSTMYFLNGIVVYNSTISEDLFLETPTNISLVEGFEQVVEHIAYYNLEFNESLKAFTFKVEAGSPFEGFFISKVRLCSKEFSMIRSYLMMAMYNPKYSYPSFQDSIPSEVRKDYISPPHPKVIEVVVPAYEEWFRDKFGMDIKNASSLGLAVTAARFIYSEYINYTASEVPRSIEDVIEARKGDCDDMSRILVELLNYYNIPALMVSGYTYIDGFEYRMPVKNVTYIFLNNGPHAFTMAYIPGLGWVSLDFLAGSLIYYPFIVEQYTRETATPGEEVVEEFFNLHRALNATQVIAILSEKAVEDRIGFPVTPENLRRYFNGVISSLYTVTTPIETTQTPTYTTPITSVSTVTQTAHTTDQPQPIVNSTAPTGFQYTETGNVRNNLLSKAWSIVVIIIITGITVAVCYMVIRRRT